MQENIQYGTVRATQTLDDNGSTVTQKTSYKDSRPVGQQSKYYEIRKPANGSLEVITRFSAFVKELDQDASKCDPSFRLENFGHPTKTTYTVSCYTVFE